MPKIAIIYYSGYGHVKKLADKIKAGAESTGVEVDLFQVPETLDAAALAAVGAPPKPNDPVMDRKAIAKLPDYDGFVFGMPTRFGMMAHQMKSFFDGTYALWQGGKLIGKPATMFVTTSAQDSGQETTHLAAVTQLVHHGMVYVPLGFPAEVSSITDDVVVHVCSPYGASTHAGPDHSRQPSEQELTTARLQGERFANVVQDMGDPSPAAFSKLMHARYSCKTFDSSRPIPEDVLTRVMELTQRACTSFNTQPWVAVLVKSPEAKQKLIAAMFDANVPRVESAPISVVFAGDMEAGKLLGDDVPDLVKQALPTCIAHSSPEAWAFKQSMMAVATFLLASQACGLNANCMEGFTSPQAVKDAVGLTDRYCVPCVVSVGYEKEPRKHVTDRFPSLNVWFKEQFRPDGVFNHKTVTNLAAVCWVRGVAVPLTLANGFLAALKAEHVDHSAGATNAWFDKMAVTKKIREVLAPEQAAVQNSADKRAAVEALSVRLSMTYHSKRWVRGVAVPVSVANSFLDALTAEFVELASDATNGFFEKKAVDEKIRVVLRPELDAVRSSGDKVGAIRSLAVRWAQPLQVRGAHGGASASSGSAVPAATNLAAVCWVRGLAIPLSIASGFIVALKAEHLDLSAGATNAWFDKMAVTKKIREVLAPEQEAVLNSADKRAAVEALSVRLAVAGQSKRWVRGVSIPVPLTHRFIDALTAEFVGQSEDATNTFFEKMAIDEDIRVALRPELDAVRSSGDKAGAIRSLAARWAEPLQQRGARGKEEPYTVFYHSAAKAFTGRAEGILLMLEEAGKEYVCVTPDKYAASPMKAVLNTAYGDLSTTLKVDTCPVPKFDPESAMLLVKVHAAAINPIDYKVMLGHMKPYLGELKHFPRVPGCDVSGVVVKAGAACKWAKPGDRIFADWPGNVTGMGVGTLAEYTLMPETYACVAPANLSFVQAAAIPLAGLTAYQALKHQGGLERGMKVLVLGGSGGTGTFALACAKNMGAAHIATTSSSVDLCKNLGADRVVNYKQGEDVGEVLAGGDYDVVFDCVGGLDGWEKSKKVMKPGARYVTIAGPPVPDEQHAGFVWKSFFTDTGTEQAAADLTALKEMCESGSMMPVLDPSSPYTLDTAPKAFALLQSQRAKGKLVIKICADDDSTETEDVFPGFAPPMVRTPSGITIAQTSAIMWLLGKELGLYPTGGHAEETHAMQMSLDSAEYLSDALKARKEDKAKHAEFLQGRMAKWLDTVEQGIAASSGQFVVGTAVTYADFAILFSLNAIKFAFGEPFNAEMAKRQRLATWEKMMLDRPKIKAFYKKGVPILPDMKSDE